MTFLLQEDIVHRLADLVYPAVDGIAGLLVFDRKAPMLFSSGIFWLLFLFFLPIFAAIRKNKLQVMLFVVAFSLFFYYKSSGFFLFLLVATSLIDWLVSRQIAKSHSEGYKRLWMWLSICVSLSVLGYFKYANFFLWNWNQMVQGNFQPLDLILPVGISFYTFQSISYVVDVRKGRIKPTASWLEYLFFLSFFPALVAGPIVRADFFLPQLKDNKPATRNDIYGGFWLIIVGLVKKALIADYISHYNDLVFNDPGLYHGVEALMGVLGYTMQIYCDFSGYSDMAIGLALIMGFKLGLNFDSPYQSRNLTDFWRRWHISLSSWLRDYVYIPLGGNRKGTLRTYVNNFLTMLIGGLWHGAAWKFVFWGGMHGVGLAIHKACKPVLKKIPDNFATNFFFWLLTFVYVSALWVFFRAVSFYDSVVILQSVFENFDWAYFPVFFKVRDIWCLMMLAIVVMHFVPQRWSDGLCTRFIKAPWILKILVFIVVVQLVIEFQDSEVAPFIYFQF